MRWLRSRWGSPFFSRSVKYERHDSGELEPMTWLILSVSSVTSARCHDDIAKRWHMILMNVTLTSSGIFVHIITFIQILFDFVQLLIKHGKLLLSVCMLLFLHLKMRGCYITSAQIRLWALCYVYLIILYFVWQCTLVIQMTLDLLKIFTRYSPYKLHLTYQQGSDNKLVLRQPQNFNCNGKLLKWRAALWTTCSPFDSKVTYRLNFLEDTWCIYLLQCNNLFQWRIQEILLDTVRPLQKKFTVMFRVYNLR